MKKVKQIFSNLYVNYILSALVLNLLIESFSRHSFFKALLYIKETPVIFLLNSAIILCTLYVALIFKRRMFVVTFVGALWLIAGIANGIVLGSRVTPFTASDLKLVKYAIAIVNNYIPMYQIILIVVGVVSFVVFTVYWWFKAPKIDSKIPYVRHILIVVLMFLGVINVIYISTDTGILPTKFGNIAQGYLDYGFPYCFSNTLLNTGISKPDNYSTELVEEIVDEVETDTSKKETETDNVMSAVDNDDGLPNIIFIQLESFFDPLEMKNLTFSEDPIPTFRKLYEECSSGYLSVPSVGAGTANTEFEIISAMNLDFFGLGEYPYKTILKKSTCESIAYNLSDKGYKTHAIHNNDATFYDRNNVFSKFGFDTFTPLEYMRITETTPMGWAKDRFLVENILQALDSTKERDFVYTISVQGHGEYPSYDIGLDKKITIDGIEDEERKNSFEYYVNEIAEMDDFIEVLLSKLKLRDERTILVMYGDHLPSLSITEDELSNGDLFQTKYVVWSNYDLPVVHKDVEAYQLTSQLFTILNWSEGTMIKYHQARSEDEDYIDNMQVLEYDILYGDHNVYNGESPYKPSDMQMGVLPITVNRVYENDGVVYIAGRNFTEYSVVYINDEECDTEYLSQYILRVKDTEIKNGDEVKVSQRGDDKIVLGSSNTYVYENDEVTKDNEATQNNENTQDNETIQNSENKKDNETTQDATNTTESSSSAANN